MSDSADPSVRVGVDVFLLFSESGSDRTRFSPSLEASAVSAGRSSDFSSGALGVMRWLEKPPDPSAVRAHEPKMKVVPSGTMLASLDPAIEFADELAESPTWHASCRCLSPSLLRDTLGSRVCR